MSAPPARHGHPPSLLVVNVAEKQAKKLLMPEGPVAPKSTPSEMRRSALLWRRVFDGARRLQLISRPMDAFGYAAIARKTHDERPAANGAGRDAR